MMNLLRNVSWISLARALMCFLFRVNEHPVVRGMEFSTDAVLQCVYPDGHTTALLSESGYNSNLVQVALTSKSDDSYTATICGTGPMVFTDLAWKSDEYRNSITSVVIGNYYDADGQSTMSAVETIQAYAFSECTSLQSVSISKTKGFMFIDAYAFANCSALRSLLLPDSLFGYGSFSFYGVHITGWDNTACGSPASEIECFGENSFRKAFHGVYNVGAVGHTIGFGRNCFSDNIMEEFEWTENGCGSSKFASEWVDSIEDVVHGSNGLDPAKSKILEALAKEARSVLSLAGVIQYGAFSASSVQRITISTLWEVSAHAFSWCPNLNQVHIDRCMFIHEDAFVESPRLTSIVYCGDVLYSMNGGIINVLEGAVKVANEGISVFSSQKTDGSGCSRKFSCDIFVPPTNKFDVGSYARNCFGVCHYIIPFALFADIL